MFMAVVSAERLSALSVTKDGLAPDVTSKRGVIGKKGERVLAIALESLNKNRLMCLRYFLKRMLNSKKIKILLSSLQCKKVYFLFQIVQYT